MPSSSATVLTCARWPSEDDASYRRAVSWCYWFARLLGDEGRFFVTHRQLGKLTGVSHVTASGYLRRMQGEGLLDLREKGWRGHASRYTFMLEAVILAAV